MGLITKLIKWADRRSRTVHLALTLLLIVVIALLNHHAGAQIILSQLYLFPVIYAAWYLGFKYGVLTTALCLASSVLWRWKTGLYLEIPWVLFGPFLGRIGIFLFASFLIAKLKTSLRLQKEANEKLLYSYEQCQKLSNIKADFTTKVSHDLRAPLAAMKQGIEVLYDGILGEMSKEQKECLALAKRSVDRLKHLIDEILDFSKLDEGKRAFNFEQHDLCQELNEAHALFRPLAEQKGVEIKTDFPPEGIKLYFDSTSIHQVMNNLVSNAMKFIEKGSITIGAKANGPFAHVYVKDTGPGIPEEDRSRLFKPFEKIVSPDGKYHEGAGLGLAISKELVARHGGKIWAESRVGEGTTFHFTLSLSPPE